jgi:hypothetical protein
MLFMYIANKLTSNAAYPTYSIYSFVILNSPVIEKVIAPTNGTCHHPNPADLHLPSID